MNSSASATSFPLGSKYSHCSQTPVSATTPNHFISICLSWNTSEISSFGVQVKEYHLHHFQNLYLGFDGKFITQKAHWWEHSPGTFALNCIKQTLV